MNDLISRQAVLDYIDNMPSELTADGRRMIRRIRLTEYIQDSLPSAEPERKKGRWVWLSSTYDRTPCEMLFWCSECHHETVVHTNGTSEPWEHYCPNCGAYMWGGEDDV